MKIRNMCVGGRNHRGMDTGRPLEGLQGVNFGEENDDSPCIKTSDAFLFSDHESVACRPPLPPLLSVGEGFFSRLGPFPNSPARAAATEGPASRL